MFKYKNNLTNIINKTAKGMAIGSLALSLTGCPEPINNFSNTSISNTNQSGHYVSTQLNYDDGNPNTTSTVNAQLSYQNGENPSQDALDLTPNAKNNTLGEITLKEGEPSEVLIYVPNTGNNLELNTSINGVIYNHTIPVNNTIEQIFVSDDFEEKVIEELTYPTNFNTTTSFRTYFDDGNFIYIDNGIVTTDALRSMSTKGGSLGAIDDNDPNLYTLYNLNEEERNTFYDKLEEIIDPAYITDAGTYYLNANITSGIGNLLKRNFEGTYNGPNFEFSNSKSEGSAKVIYEKSLDNENKIYLRLNNDEIETRYNDNNNEHNLYYIHKKDKAIYYFNDETKLYKKNGGLDEYPDNVKSINELIDNEDEISTNFNNLLDSF